MLYQRKNIHGGDIYRQGIALDFSANTNPLGTPAAVKQAVIDSLENLHRYPDAYCRNLVDSISKFEQVDSRYILCGNGAAEIIYAFCSAVKPKTAVEFAPTFSEYSLALKHTDCQISRYVLKKENDFLPDSEFLNFLKCKKPNAVFICNPNNPTGKLIPHSLLTEILDFCRKNDSFLFLDECFLDMTFDGVSMKTQLLENPNLLILKAFTKSYGMAGLRLGYALCSNENLLKKISEQTQPWNISVPAQAAGSAALSQQEFLKTAKIIIEEEKQWLKNQFERFGFWVCDSDANFLLFKAPCGLADELEKKGISIRNCSNYYGLGEGFYRIGIRLHKENAQLISAIEQILSKEQLWQKI